MSRYHYDHIRENENFHRLVAQKSRLSWGLALVMMLVYFSFILIIAFYPEWLAARLHAGTIITWGLAIGIGIIFFTFMITGIYVYKANRLYDGLMQEVIDASHAHVKQMAAADRASGA